MDCSCQAPLSMGFSRQEYRSGLPFPSPGDLPYPRIKAILIEKKCEKAKWLSQEALQIAAKRREAKCKGEKERYKHLNADFQRIARRDKKAFISNQCKEIEENNRMGKTRELFTEKEMATHSSVLAWRIPGTGEPGGLPSMGLHRVGHD